MRFLSAAWAVVCCVAALPALAQDAVPLGDLKPKSPVTMTREALLDLMPGAKLTGYDVKGAQNAWTNAPSGEMAIDGQPIAVRQTHRVEPGQRVTVAIPGGGGFGHPRERAPELVAADLDAGALTAAFAADVYGHEAGC